MKREKSRILMKSFLSLDNLFVSIWYEIVKHVLYIKRSIRDGN